MKDKNLEKWLIVPDTHRPYHDQRAVDLVYSVAASGSFDGVAILGDYGEFFGVSSHDKDPNKVVPLEDEIEDINAGLDDFDSLGFEKKIFIAGNHENRLERYLMTKAPELFNMVKIEQLLKLQERGWSYTPYKDHTAIGKLHLTHDTGKAGRYAHAQSLNDFQTNVVIGHTHRMGYIIEGNAMGKPHVGAMLGWLGDIEQIDYMHKIKARRDWALGFGVAYVERKTGHAHLVPMPIIDYKVVFEGKLYCV